MSMTGNEINVNGDEYFIRMKDGKYFFLGKLKDRRKSFNCILNQYSVNYTVFIFEHMPPKEKVQMMCLWHYYPIFKCAKSNEHNANEIL